MNSLISILVGFALILLVMTSGCVAPGEINGDTGGTANITAPPGGEGETAPSGTYGLPVGKPGVSGSIAKNGFNITFWDVDPDFGTGLPLQSGIQTVFGLTFNIERTGPSSVPESMGDCDGLPSVGLWDPNMKKMYINLNPYPRCDNKTEMWRKTVYIDRRVYALDRPVQIVVSMLDDITDSTSMDNIDLNSPTKYVFEIVPFEQV